jgi:hypothetical protein
MSRLGDLGRFPVIARMRERAKIEKSAKNHILPIDIIDIFDNLCS